MAHFVPCVDVPEDGFDDFEFAKYLEVARQAKRSKTLPNALVKRMSSLVGEVLSTCSFDKNTTVPSNELTDDSCVVGYMETAYSVLHKVHSIGEEIRSLLTGDDCNEIQKICSGDCNEIRNIVTGGEEDGWYPVPSPAPLPLPSAAVCLRTMPFSTHSLPLPAIMHEASRCQISTLCSGLTAAISPVTIAADALKPIEAPEAGERPVASVVERTPLRIADSLVDLLNKEKKEDNLEDMIAKTTLMLCNIPSHHSRSSVMDMLRSEGLGKHVTLIYIPMNLKSRSNFGYAFVDFDSVRVAEQCKKQMDGFTRWSEPSEKVLSIGWSDTQGLDAHIQRYRNSPLMHESVDDELKPALFVNGARVAFPEPTKNIRAPRLRRSNDQTTQARNRSLTV